MRKREITLGSARRPAGRVAIFVLLAGLIFATGCNLTQWRQNGFKVGPEYCPPTADIAENWIDSDDPRVIPAPPQHEDWWLMFQDPVLNSLVEGAYLDNLSLRAAGLRVLQARAQRDIVTGNLFPQVQQLEGGYSREQLSAVQQPYLDPIPGLFSRSFDSWSFAGNLSWELDFWGRFRRAVEAADAGLEGSVHDYDALLVSLVAEVATAYVETRTFEQRLNFARQNVKNQEGSKKLTEARAKEGKTGQINVYLAESNLNSTKASLQQLEIGLRQSTNRVCTLLGLPPARITEVLGVNGEIPTAPTEVAIGIPSNLLRRRPDVRAAERRIAAQSAQIGVATAELYPAIAINGRISVGAEEFNDLFSSLSQGGSIGPSFQWNVLNYGRIANNIRVQDARFRELIALYQNTVLSANEEVENALVSFFRTQQQVEFLSNSTNATQEALDLALILFKEGETDFTPVFVLQGDLAEKQDQLAAARGKVVTSLIDVYRALGGGWEFRCNRSGSLAVEQITQPSPIDPTEIESNQGRIRIPRQKTSLGEVPRFIRQAFSQDKPDQRLR